MIKSSSNIFTLILIVIVMLLIGYIFTQDKPDYIKDYNNKIEALEQKIDSLHSKNNVLEKQADSLELKLTESDKRIKQLNSRIYVIKKETQKQLDAVDLFGDDDLERFFAKRYGQYKDSIN